MTRLIKVVATAVPLVFAAHAAGADNFVRMITGPAGGSWYPFGAKMAEMWGKQIEGITASSGPGGGVGNMRDINRGNAEVGWTFGNTAYDGYSGKGPFKEPLKNVMWLANLYPGILQTAVPKNSPIKSYKDLADKRLSPGKLTFSGNIAFEKLLKLYGITYEDVKKKGGQIHRVGYSDSVALMKDRHIDVFVGLTTAPNASYLALEFEPGIRFLGTSEEIAAKFVQQNPGFVKAKITPSVYKSVSEPVLTIAAPTVLIINKSVSSDLAYKLAKVLWENHGELVKVNKFWENVKLADAAEGAAIPIHPGAMKYYKEKGVAK